MAGPNVLWEDARACLARGDLLGAQSRLLRLIRSGTRLGEAHTSLAEIYLAMGRLPEAEAELRRALAVPVCPGRAATLLARLYNDNARPDAALTIAEPRCSVPPLDVELATQHVAALGKLGRAGEAVTFYQRRNSLDTERDASDFALALALHQSGQFEQAESILARARGARSGAWLHLHARCLAALHRWGPAESALRECAAQGSASVEALTTLAQLIWIRCGSLAQAMAPFEEALAHRPADDALRAGMSSVALGAGEPRIAYECLAERVSRTDAPPMLLIRAGMAALEFNSRTALALADRALQSFAQLPAARALRCAALLGTGDAAASLKECEALLARSPDDQYLIALQTTAWRLLGDARYERYCDYDQLVLPLVIEPPAGWRDLSAFLADVRARLETLHNPNGHPLLFQSLRRGTETSQDLARSEDPVIQALFGAFSAPIEAYIRRLRPAHDPPASRRRAGWRFNGSWSVRLRDQGFHTSHVHPRGWISSACYISLPREARGTEAGSLTFGVPSIPTYPPLSVQRRIMPTEGALVLFPSYFWHGTEPFCSEQARLTVAFDVVPDGPDRPGG